MDVHTEEYFKLRPLIVQHYLWDIEMQGQLVTLKAKKQWHDFKPTPKREKVSMFSRPARLRMLKFTATIDWDDIPRGKFITLTYPDECVNHTYRERNVHLDRFHDYLERHLGRRVSLLWRVEWVPRQSGQYVGQWEPHIHLIVLGVGYVEYASMRQWWRQIIGAKEEPHIRFEEMENPRQCGFYISKYCAKVPVSSNLVNAPYPKTEGRHYGYLRRSGIPRCGSVAFRNVEPSVILDVRRVLSLSNPLFEPARDLGVSALGDRALAVRAKIWQLCLDGNQMPIYDTPI